MGIISKILTIFVVNTFSAEASQEMDPPSKKSRTSLTCWKTRLPLSYGTVFFSKCSKFYVNFKNAIEILQKYKLFWLISSFVWWCHFRNILRVYSSSALNVLKPVWNLMKAGQNIPKIHHFHKIPYLKKWWQIDVNQINYAIS